MSTDTQADAREQADYDAVLRHALRGQPLEADVARRVREQAARVTDRIYRQRGEIDTESISALFRDDDET